MRISSRPFHTASVIADHSRAVTFLVADGVARIKVPERLEIVDAMPLNPTGKILKRVLRARFEQEAAPA